MEFFRKLVFFATFQHIQDNEHVEYYHGALAASMVAPGYFYALPLRPEFITPQDRDKKQDCGIKAAYRWLDNHAQHHASLKPIYPVTTCMRSNRCAARS